MGYAYDGGRSRFAHEAGLRMRPVYVWAGLRMGEVPIWGRFRYGGGSGMGEVGVSEEVQVLDWLKD